MRENHDDYEDGLLFLLAPLLWVVDAIYKFISWIGGITKEKA